MSRKTISRIWVQIKHQQQHNQFPINVNNKRIGKKSRVEIPFDDTKFKGHEKTKRQVKQQLQGPWELAKAQFGDGKRRSTFESTPMQYNRCLMTKINSTD